MSSLDPLRTAGDHRYRSLSWWHDSWDGPMTSHPMLPGDRDVDVAIVGAGYTGLWTAYYLKQADPGLRIAILERDVVGFGASGRNGGWASAIFPATPHKVATHSSRDAAVRMQQAMNDTVDEVIATAAAEGIDADIAKGGYVALARNQAQWVRAQAEVAHWREWGFAEDQVELLDADQAAARAAATDVLGGVYTPHCAAIHPYKLVRGLADRVTAMGVEIFEHTPVTDIGIRRVATPFGVVTADVVVRATEGYTPDLPGFRRDIVPMYSLMVATEPLPQDVWDRIGLAGRETFSDERHLRIYGQRTADDRIAFGGRGAPYHFASTVRPEYDRDDRVHEMLRDTLRSLFPVIGDAQFTHAWGGNLGIPRDWYPSVGFNPATGYAFAGGYVGDGVTTTNLAGRTLRDMILRRGTDLLDLPWVHRRSRKWEPEPLRWLGVNAGTIGFTLADRTEAATGRPSRIASMFWSLLGH
jgi:glycine/D-amino acid oxidase-like deaminating enzyme